MRYRKNGGKKLDYRSEREYIGNLAQLFSVKEYKLIGGKQDGVKAIDICNGSGLDVTILPDRCLDFYQIKLKGKNLNFITPSGIVSPHFYDDTKTDWLKTWAAGFLTTCGFENIGSDGIDDGEALGIHGRLGNSPADFVSIAMEIIDDIPTVNITGTINQGYMFGENLVLKRTITMKYGINEITFKDDIYNAGFDTRPMMLLYHFNMGYPLLSSKSDMIIPSANVTGRTKHAQNHIDTWKEITPPKEGYMERCYYHDIVENQDGTATVGIDNKEEELSVRIHYDRHLLDHFVQWKMFGQGLYALGLEPCNATIDGRADAKKNGTLKYIEPNEHKLYQFKIVIS